MTTLKALDGNVQMISGEGEFFYSEAERFVEELKNYSTASSHYTVISIIGPQSSGKSYMLNTLFGTKFEVLNAAGGRKKTTKGIWIAKCVNPCMIIMDVEGMNGRERGEDDTLFERQSALFSLRISEVLLLNMWFHDIGRWQGANLGLIELIFEQRVKIEAPKTTIIILVRDYDYETPPDFTNKELNKYMNEIWEKVHPAPSDRKMSDYIEVGMIDIPDKKEKQEFSQKSKELAEFLCFFAANNSLEKNHGASGFAHSSKLIWDLICSNKRLSVTDHKLAMSAYLCNEIKNEIFSSFHQDREYWCLMTGTSITSVEEFNTKLLFFVERILARYEEDSRAFDSNTRKEVWDKLEEEILQMMYSPYVLYKIKDEILDSCDPEGYHSLTVKEFNIKLPLILEGKLARYDEETRQIDESIKGNFRERLEEQILQRFKPTFEDKLFRLSHEILTSAKPEVRRKMRKLPEINKQSVIEVLRPYLQYFNYNSSADVHPYFGEVLNKHRNQLVESLTKIGEKKGNKFLKIALRASVASVKLIIGTAWAICTGDIVGATTLYSSAIGRIIVRHAIKDVIAPDLLMDS